MGNMKIHQLILIGVGGIIGAGFFLGSGLPIQLAGPAVLVSFLIGAWVTAQVTGALTTLAANHPDVTSFQAFSERYLGAYVGYVQGWVYFVSSVLAIASESVAMAIFIRFWFPGVPTSASAFVFAAVVIAMNAFGVQNFERVESVMSVVKIIALVGFIVIVGVSVAFGLPHLFQSVHSPATGVMGEANVWHAFAPHGVSGILQSMLIVIFAFSGIGVFATAATQMHSPRRLDIGAIVTVVSLTVLYLLSVGLVLIVVPWHAVGTGQSPFVLALQRIHARALAEVINATVLVAAFSVMAGAVYSCGQILRSLASTGHAPRWLGSQSRRQELLRVVFTGIGVFGALALSFLLPENVYNLLISASSYFTFLNWSIIMGSYLSWRRQPRHGRVFHSFLSRGAPVTTWITLALVLAMTGYSLAQKDQRTGFYVALAVVAVLSGLFMLFNRGHGEQSGAAVTFKSRSPRRGMRHP